MIKSRAGTNLQQSDFQTSIEIAITFQDFFLEKDKIFPGIYRKRYLLDKHLHTIILSSGFAN